MDVSPDEIAAAQLAEDATAWDKRMQALTMRNAGATFARIAANFGISTDRAKAWVHRATLDVVKLPTDQMVDRQRSILLDIVRVNYPDAMNRDNPDRRDAQRTIINCLEHEAKLFGLYAPQRVSIGISEAEFGQQALDLLKLVGTAPLAELAGLPSLPANTGSTINTALTQIVDAEEVTDPDTDDDESWSNL